MKIDIIAGARPNFVKIASIITAINQTNRLTFRLIHTGQHYDYKMSGVFFDELNIPQPHVNLCVGSGTQAEQTSAIMLAYESLLLKQKTAICLVVGDTNSAMSCAIVAKKMNITVAHVEAGIRSFDLTMPEEINRILIDAISDYFYTTSEYANENLIKTGVPMEKIIFVGNTMIDTLLSNLSFLYPPEVYLKNNLSPRNYLVLTLHRPANVDNVSHLSTLLKYIIHSSRAIPVIFPIHPRTAQKLNIKIPKNLILCEPLSYLSFNYLIKNAKAVITDSGGITEETTVMNIPCLSLRNTTERLETVEFGSTELVGSSLKNIKYYMKQVFDDSWKKSTIPELWDGKSAIRIVQHLDKLNNDI